MATQSSFAVNAAGQTLTFHANIPRANASGFHEPGGELNAERERLCRALGRRPKLSTDVALSYMNLLYGPGIRVLLQFEDKRRIVFILVG